NIIGLNAAGSAAVGNALGGVLFSSGSAGNRVGGGTPTARNVISGNLGYGILINGSARTRTTVQGNYVRTDVTRLKALGHTGTGLKALGNTGIGVGAANGYGGNVIGTDGDGVNDVGEGNVISGNGQQGVILGDVNSLPNVVAGNLIGLGADGSTPLGNSVGIL